MGEELGEDKETEELEQTLFRTISEVPEDRRTPLDVFVAESFIEEKIVTRKQLFDSLEVWKSSAEPRTLCQTMLSRGHISDADVDVLLKLYGRRVQSRDSSEEPSDIVFGEIAVQKKLTTQAEIWSAIEEQERRRAAGSEQRLGEILVDRGSVTIEQAKDILETQGKRILHCPNCGDQFNVTNYSPDKEYSCLSCGGKLSDTGEIFELTVKGTAAEATIRKQPPKTDSIIGRQIGGCRIISKIGEGGMGAVYKAEHIRLDRPVAIKLMAPGLMGEVHRKRFVREARAAAQLDHPNIMTVYDVDEFENFLYIVMQYIDGRSIGDMLDAKGKFDQLSALRIVLQAAEALEAANEHHIVHRDIKPDNIMLTQAGQVKVMDFGLAKRTGPEDVGVTASGAILGTPLYMSPEQFNAEALDGRSDIYSLGATFYHMVTGRPPFEGETVFELRDKHMKAAPPSPKKFSPELSPRVCRLIERMLAKNKFKRYKSTSELITDLKATLAELGGKPGTTAELAKRKGALKYALPAALALVAVVALVLLLSGKSPSPLDSELEKRADKAYAGLRPQVFAQLTAKEYGVALELLNSFPAEFANTKAWRDADTDKLEVMRLAIHHFEEVLEAINKKIAGQNFAGALRESRVLASQAHELKSQIAIMPKSGEFAQLTAQAQQRADAAESTNTEIGRFDESRQKVDALVKEGKLDEAKSLLSSLEIKNPVLDGQVQEITRKLEERKTLSKDAQNEWNRWNAANKQARVQLDAGNFDGADSIITYGKFEQSSISEVVAEARALRSEIAQGRQEHLASLQAAQIEKDLEEARDLVARWKLEEAKEIVQRHSNEKGFKDKISNLLSAIDEHQQYLEDAAEVEKLIAAAKGAQAREKLAKWLASPDPGIARRARELDKKTIPVLYADMVYFTSGTYKLGDSRTANLNAFYIDRYEVTNKQYAQFLKATRHPAPHNWKPDSMPEHPVTGVSYDDAAAYAKWAGKRFPTEDEWEVAASWDPVARKALTFPWGSDFDPGKCNLDSWGTEPVGRSSGDVSACGVHDMAGNVCEWTGAKENSKRIVRGGSWADSGSKAACCSARLSFDPKTRNRRLGFRCARDAK